MIDVELIKRWVDLYGIGEHGKMTTEELNQVRDTLNDVLNVLDILPGYDLATKCLQRDMFALDDLLTYRKYNVRM